MQKYPVKCSLILAFLSSGVMPVLMLFYVGLFVVDFLGLLSLFSTTYTVLSVVLPFLFLLLTWGNIYLLHSLLATLPVDLFSVKSLRRLWIFLTFFAGALSVLSPLYSIFVDCEILRALWSVAFFMELIVGAVLGVLVARFAYMGRNIFLFAIGVALSASFLTDACGLKMIQTTIDKNMKETEIATNEDISGSNWIFAVLGFSSVELETLDDESFADVQEAVFVGAGFAVAFFAGWVTFHTAAATVFFVLCALYFARKNSSRPFKPCRKRSKNQEVQVC